MVGDGRPSPRVLLLTAAIGEGHNVAARAINRRISQVWPAAEVCTLDAVALMAPGMSWLTQSAYRLVLDRAPGVYQLFYDLLWRHRWFAWLSKRLVAAWCGWRLWPRLRRFQPDMVICTHPYGAAAMDRLRRVRRLVVPTAIFVTDFAPHPFWVFPHIDLHFVMHRLSALEARRLGARGPVLVAAPPVLPAFRPGDQGAARRALGLRAGALVVLVTGGGWGVGTLAETVAALLGLGAESGGRRGERPRVQVVAVCGRNQALRQHLEWLSVPRARLVPLGFVERMPELLAAADVVVTNAGGVTALEAFASARPVLVFDPIPGHGRANAKLMEAAGLALVCHSGTELEATVLRLAGDRDGDGARLAALRAAELDQLAGKDLAEDLVLLAGAVPLPPPPPGRAVRRAARILVAGATAVALLFQGSWVAGTSLAPAARGSPRDSGAVAVVVAGSLPPATLRALAAAAERDRLALTLFIEGEDVTADRGELATLAAHGFEIEAGTWRAQRDATVKPGSTRAEFERTVWALRQARLRPAYVAEPCGRFSLLAVAVTRSLHVRRVVFGQRLTVARGRRLPPPAMAAGRIVALLVTRSALPADAAAAVDAVAAAVGRRGLRALTLAQLDRAGRATGRHAAMDAA
jgi:UDP-N-acetylglucosamine:LPS N-acetylglucosamine transferase